MTSTVMVRELRWVRKPLRNPLDILLHVEIDRWHRDRECQQKNVRLHCPIERLMPATGQFYSLSF